MSRSSCRDATAEAEQTLGKASTEQRVPIRLLTPDSFPDSDQGEGCVPVLNPTLSTKGEFLIKQQLSSETQTTAQLLWVSLPLRQGAGRREKGHGTVDTGSSAQKTR